MIVFMFQLRFVPMVLDWTKLHTIRAQRKRPVRSGDTLSLRRWSGAAYRSSQVILHQAVPCTRVDFIDIGGGQLGDDVRINGQVIPITARSALARADGFSGWFEMIDWFENVHGLPFTGTLIHWAKP